MQDGRVGAIEIRSRLGEPCRLRNPWSKPCRVAEIGGTVRELSGDILCFDTRREGRYHLIPADQPAALPTIIRPPAEASPASYQFTLSNGRVVQGRLGRPR